MKDFPTYFTGEHALSMTMRDYFAAKAMVALTQRRHPYEILEEEYTKDIYKAAYKMADAMMEARK